MIQHNGFYSCTYCLHPGESFPTENYGTSVAFPPSVDRSYRLRSEVTYRWAIQQQKKKGKPSRKTGNGNISKYERPIYEAR